MAELRAQCHCGAVTARLPGPTPAVVACHCADCQRRSGSPFGVLAYYPVDRVALSGSTTIYSRPTDEGNRFDYHFCPTCGSTVYVTTTKHAGLIGIAVGAIADPTFPLPVRSVWERSMHGWVAMPADITHFPRGPG